MPWKQWAYLEKVSSADFQTYLQNQTVPQFTSVAQRDSVYTPVPPAKGAFCITVDTFTQWVWSGTQWVKAPWGTAWGIVGYAEVLGNVGPITGPGNITALNFTYQTVAGRRLRLLVDTMFVGTVAASEARLYALRDATQLQYRAVYLAVVGRAYAIQSSAIFTSDAASHSYNAQMGISSGSGQVSTNAAAGIPTYIMLEDLGPAPGTVPTLLPAPEPPARDPAEIVTPTT
jgi:hypothetical protein